jgi:hypothetical protein
MQVIYRKTSESGLKHSLAEAISKAKVQHKKGQCGKNYYGNLWYSYKKQLLQK